MSHHTHIITAPGTSEEILTGIFNQLNLSGSHVMDLAGETTGFADLNADQEESLRGKGFTVERLP